jgi:hypothetical protein
MNSASLPVVVLTVLGALIAVLGLFAAGNIWIVVIGLAAIVIAGILYTADRRRQ